jgi:hypothetical protein
MQGTEAFFMKPPISDSPHLKARGGEIAPQARASLSRAELIETGRKSLVVGPPVTERHRKREMTDARYGHCTSFKVPLRRKNTPLDSVTFV